MLAGRAANERDSRRRRLHLLLGHLTRGGRRLNEDENENERQQSECRDETFHVDLPPSRYGKRSPEPNCRASRPMFCRDERARTLTEAVSLSRRSRGWQVVLSVVLLGATTIALAWFAGRAYRIGILMYGKKPTIPEIVRWVRYKP